MFLGTDWKCWSDEGQTDTQISNCRKVLPICPAWCGGVRVHAGIHALPLEDAHVLCRLALQPEGVLVEGGRVVELVVHVLDQAVQLSPWLQNNKFASLAAHHRCLNQKMMWTSIFVALLVGCSHLSHPLKGGFFCYRPDLTDMWHNMWTSLSNYDTRLWYCEESEDYSPCKSNSNCPKSPRHHPLGRRLCTSGCQPLSKNDKDMKMKTTTIKSKAVNSDVKTNSWFKFLIVFFACVASVCTRCVHPWIILVSQYFLLLFWPKSILHI